MGHSVYSEFYGWNIYTSWRLTLYIPNWIFQSKTICSTFKPTYTLFRSALIGKKSSLIPLARSQLPSARWLVSKISMTEIFLDTERDVQIRAMYRIPNYQIRILRFDTENNLVLQYVIFPGQIAILYSASNHRNTMVHEAKRKTNTARCMPYNNALGVHNDVWT